MVDITHIMGIHTLIMVMGMVMVGEAIMVDMVTDMVDIMAVGIGADIGINY
jgi:hypothetical protein